MKRYMLTVRVEFDAPDDVEARKRAQALLDLPPSIEAAQLREVFPHSPPRPVLLAKREPK